MTAKKNGGKLASRKGVATIVETKGGRMPTMRTLSSAQSAPHLTKKQLMERESLALRRAIADAEAKEATASYKTMQRRRAEGELVDRALCEKRIQNAGAKFRAACEAIPARVSASVAEGDRGRIEDEVRRGLDAAIAEALEGLS